MTPGTRGSAVKRVEVRLSDGTKIQSTSLDGTKNESKIRDPQLGIANRGTQLKEVDVSKEHVSLSNLQTASSHRSR